MNTQPLIDALHKGRYLYPKQIQGQLYNGTGACALGAIAAGLGIKGSEDEIYNGLSESFQKMFNLPENEAITIVDSIWAVNDNDENIYIKPDTRVIKYLKSIGE